MKRICDIKNVLLMVCILCSIGLAVAQSYIMVPGTDITPERPTNLILNYDLSYIDSNLEPGDSGIMSLVIQNSGGQNAEDVEVWIPDAGDIRISKRWYFGTLLQGRTVKVSTKFNVAKDAWIGMHSVPVSIMYDGYDADGDPINNQKDTWEININVRGESIFIVEDITLDGVLKPGDTSHLRVNLRNKGIGTAFDTDAELNLAALPGINVIGPEKQYLGDIEKNKAVNTEFTLYLDDDIATGAYSIPLTLSYEDRDHTSHTTNLPIGIKVVGDIRIGLSVSETDPREIHAGDEDVEIKVKIDNLGTKNLKNVKVTFNSQYPLENPKSYIQIKDMGTLVSSSSSEVSFYVDVDEDAKPQDIAQVFEVEYEVNNQVENKTIRIPIAIKEYPDFEIATETAMISAGECAELRINVKNTGSKCDSVTIWALKKSSQPFEFEDKSEYVGDLDKDEEGQAVISFTVKSSARVKEYILPIEIRCVRDDDVLVFGKSITMNVTNKPQSGLNYYLGALVLVLLVSFGIYKIAKRKKGVAVQSNPESLGG